MKIKERENMLPRLDVRGALSLLSLCLVVTGMLLAVTACSSDDDDDVLVMDDAPTTGVYEDHYYVDLGLSVMWATCNVGADYPEDHGDYYAWGETETKESYDSDNSETWKEDVGDIGGTSRDVAHVMWGGSWRMPTEDELQELLDDCSWTRATLNGTSGYKVASKKNNNYIFLPVTGWQVGSSSYGRGLYGFYWSSTPDESESRDA